MIKDYEQQVLELQQSKVHVDGQMTRRLKVYEIGMELEVEYTGEGELIIRKVVYDDHITQ